eukprot:TRINITY_DN25464_c0_g1_i1.p1 TRINITY_DN25464_c0_g1~~TRINITY_DN25464_c0_g1_i1.p1  ORF type:complete len:222 (-),score=4.58 TRINITY_DN25464_c0_g1_i1:301-885(-)
MVSVHVLASLTLICVSASHVGVGTGLAAPDVTRTEECWWEWPVASTSLLQQQQQKHVTHETGRKTEVTSAHRPATRHHYQTRSDPTSALRDHRISWGFDVSQASITVYVGDSVTWVWDQYGWHNIVSGLRTNPTSDFVASFRSAGTFTHTFSVPGQYPYHCSPHQSMNAIITVLERPVAGDSATLGQKKNNHQH